MALIRNILIFNVIHMQAMEYVGGFGQSGKGTGMKKIKILIKAVFWIGLGRYIFHYRFLKEALQWERKQRQKLDQLLRTANRMITESYKGNLIHKKLEERNMSSVAIYGMSEMGERVMEDILIHSSMKLLYGIDKRAEEMRLAVPVYTLEEIVEMEKPEAVILTTFTEDDSLKREIEEKLSCQVISLGELLYE